MQLILFVFRVRSPDLCCLSIVSNCNCNCNHEGFKMSIAFYRLVSGPQEQETLSSLRSDFNTTLHHVRESLLN
jgi:hypothetical protein